MEENFIQKRNVSKKIESCEFINNFKQNKIFINQCLEKYNSIIQSSMIIGDVENINLSPVMIDVDLKRFLYFLIFI